MNVTGTNSSSGSNNTQNYSDASLQAGNELQGQFMTLLMAQLKSQDPTAPMDATQMVGQMVSINQLNQLISIHQLLKDASDGASAAGGQ